MAIFSGSSHLIQAQRDSLTAHGVLSIPPALYLPLYVANFSLFVATIKLWASPGHRWFLKISLYPLHLIEWLAHCRYLRDVWEQMDDKYTINLAWHNFLPKCFPSATYASHCFSYPPHHLCCRCHLFASVQIRSDAKGGLSTYVT